MYVGGRHKGMDPWTRGTTQGFRGSEHVRFRGATKGGHRHVATFVGDGLDGGEIAIRGDGKTRFDDIDAQAFELSRQAKLLFQVHRAARRLLAISQSRVEDSYAFCFHNPGVWQRAMVLIRGRESQSYNFYD